MGVRAGEERGRGEEKPGEKEMKGCQSEDKKGELGITILLFIGKMK
jgi:hypothetical protein